MAIHNQLFEGYTDFIATRGVKEYRETIPVWVNTEDVVLGNRLRVGNNDDLNCPAL